MLTASSPCLTPLGPDIRLSVHDRGAVEAQRHKWIASEQAGHDLGDGAIRGWVRSHWRGFLRRAGSNTSRAGPSGLSSTKAISVSSNGPSGTRR